MKLTLKKCLPDLIVVVLFALVSFAYFFPADIEGRILYRHDSAAGRCAGQEQTEYMQRTGERTRWTNALFSGMPTYQLAPSYNSTAALSVAAKAYHLWLPENVWYLFAYLLGFYILLRAFDFRQSLAALGSILWAFSTYFLIIIAAGHIWKVIALAYLPPMIAGIVLAYKGKYLPGLVVTAFFTALEINANHVQMTYYYLFIVLALVIAYLVDALKKGEAMRFVKATAACGVGALIGVMINVSNLYHTWQYSQESMRGKSELVKPNSANQTSSGLDRDYITQWSYGVDETWTLLIPNAKGGAHQIKLASEQAAMEKCDPQLAEIVGQWYQYWGDQPFTAGPVYVGAFVLMLCILSLFIVKGPVKWALLAVTLLAIVLSWGRNCMWFTNLFIDYMPMYAKFRTVSSILVIAEFTIPLLAMFALKRIVEQPSLLTEKIKYVYISFALTGGFCLLFALMPTAFFQFTSEADANQLKQYVPAEYVQPLLENIAKVRIPVFTADCWRSFWIIAVGTLVLLLFKAGKLKSPVMIGALVVLCISDLWIVNKRYLNDGMFVDKNVREQPIAKSNAEELILQDKTPNFRVLNLASDTFNENETSYYLKSIGGYHPAKLRRYQEMIDAYIAPEKRKLAEAVVSSQGNLMAVNGDSIFPVLNMLNAKYFIFPLQNQQTAPIPNPYAMGNAWFVDKVTFADNANEEIAAVGKLKLRHEAVADKKFREVLGESVAQDSSSRVVLKTYEPNRLTYEVNSAKGGVVVFSEIYYPGWTATVDGKEVELGRVNYILRALRMEAGTHQVELAFFPKSVDTTETVAYVSLALLLLFVLLMVGRKVKGNSCTRNAACIMLLAAFAANASAQTQRPSSSMYLKAVAKSDITVPFAPSAEGVRLPIRWGMDVAWLSEQNMRKGINHIGKENLSLVRGSFQTTEALVNDESLTANQKSMLLERTKVANILSAQADFILNEDQEAGVDKYYVLNGKAIVDHWVKMIVESVKWIHNNTQHKVIALSPFNEPDYGWGQGSMSDMREICQALKEHPDLKGISITGGNTLNCDCASEWYNYLKPYVDWGNTHQLAGEFDTYAAFFDEVKKDGNHAYADELHNVGEAQVGVEYGMETAVWWGFDSRARGEFCDISNHGERIAYAELRPQWTSASVYRHDDGRVKVFVGSSERQAKDSKYIFLNTDRLAYFDGQGPSHECYLMMPGGTGYQVGQTNAERVIDVEWGADVPPHAINGTYKLMNKASGNLLSQFENNIDMGNPVAAGDPKQQWQVTPVSSRVGGDFSFYDFVNMNDNRRIDVENFSCLPEANVIAYRGKNFTANQQWYLQYAGDGYYYIRNRESALYLTAKSKYSVNHVDVNQNVLLEGEARDRQLWRFMPVDAAVETKAPTAPLQLEAVAQSASVRLTWAANKESDLAGYMVLRSEDGKDGWNTIARMLDVTTFTDHDVQPGTTYHYALKAIDKSNNMSVLSEEAAATVAEAKVQVARWHFDDDLNDATENLNDAVMAGTVRYAADHQSGSKSLLLNGSTNYLQLPYEVANAEQLTLACWVKWTSASQQWARLFDFGNGTSQYIFLTPAAGNGKMRLVVKNGGDEQILECSKSLVSDEWKHVAVTLSAQGAAIFVDGVEQASSPAISITPKDIHPLLNFIGRSQFTADPLFKGYIDDLRIFNYCMDEEGVKLLMDDTTNGIERTNADMGTEQQMFTLEGKKAGKNYRHIKVGKGLKHIQ